MITAYVEDSVMAVPATAGICVLVYFILQIREERTISNKLNISEIHELTASHPTIDDVIYGKRGPARVIIFSAGRIVMNIWPIWIVRSPVAPEAQILKANHLMMPVCVDAPFRPFCSLGMPYVRY